MSCQHHASAPATSRPIGRSWTTPISFDARASWLSISHCGPRVEADARALRVAEGGDVGAVGSAVARRPLAPVLAVPLGQRRVGREVGQRLALAGAEPVEALLAVETREQRLQRLLLEAEDRVAVDASLAVQRRSGVRQARAQVARQLFPPGQLLDAQEQRVAVAPARRVVRAGFDRPHRRRGRQRIDHQHAAAQLARPAAEACQIREVADPPAVARARRVQLGREAPGAQIVGQEAAARADDEQRLVAAAPKNAVVTERQLVRQRAVAVERTRGAVLQHQVGAARRQPVQRPIAAGQQDAHGVRLVQRRRRGLRRHAHGGLQRGPRFTRGLVSRAARVVVVLVDSEAVSRHPAVGG